MKVLRFKGNGAEWSVPLSELSPDLKRMLKMQFREFINFVNDMDWRTFSNVDPAVVAHLEISFKASDEKAA